MCQRFEYPANIARPSQQCVYMTEITQNNGHYAVQGHSRSPILVPIESPYATFY